MSEKAKWTHTPGPWKARDYPNEAGDIWIDCDSWKNPKTRSCRGGTLATAHKNGTGEGNVEANARLIALAPELVECLRKLVDAYASRKDSIRSPQGFALNQARALLARLTSGE